jgi:hypothetical protein
MDYYLETNALRQLSGKLDSLGKNCFTSALSILELVSGISNDQFTIRQRTLKNIFLSNTIINWDLIEAAQAEAFPGVQYINDNRPDSLKKLCQIIIDSNDYQESHDAALKLDHDFQFFRSLDKSYSDNFIQTTVAGNRKIKKVVEDSKNSFAGDLIYDMAVQFQKKMQYDYKLNEAMILFVISENLSKAIRMNSNTGKTNHNNLYHSYNGKIDIFIKAFAAFCAKKSSEHNAPAKNDFIDLYHLSYLKDDSFQIVTDDKMLLKICPNSISVGDFKSKYT